MVAQENHFSDAENIGKIQTGSTPATESPNAGGVGLG